MAVFLDMTWWGINVDNVTGYMVALGWIESFVPGEPSDPGGQPYEQQSGMPDGFRLVDGIEINFDDIGPVTRVPAEFDENDNIIPGTGRTTPGDHYNILVYGVLAEELLSDPVTGEPLPQYDLTDPGNPVLLPWDERTSFNQYAFTTAGFPVNAVGGNPQGVPAGWQSGDPPVRWFDPSLIKPGTPEVPIGRFRIWA